MVLRSQRVTASYCRLLEPRIFNKILSLSTNFVPKKQQRINFQKIFQKYRCFDSRSICLPSDPQDFRPWDLFAVAEEPEKSNESKESKEV